MTDKNKLDETKNKTIELYWRLDQQRDVNNPLTSTLDELINSILTTEIK